MNQIFDKLFLRVLLSVVILLSLILYRYISHLIYFKDRKFSLNAIYPEKNLAHGIYFGSRLLGIVLVMSNFSFDLSHGPIISIIELLLDSLIITIFYFLAVYIFESIILFNFSLSDEVYKQSNLSYSIVNGGISLSTAYLIQRAYLISPGSYLDMLFLWLFLVVLYGFAIKTFKLIFQINLSKSIIQNHSHTSFHFFGFLWAWAIMISNSTQSNLISYPSYIANSGLGVALNIIIFPLFYYGISKIFLIRIYIRPGLENNELRDSGLFEGVHLIISAYLTTVITSQVSFGTFYPSSSVAF